MDKTMLVFAMTLERQRMIEQVANPLGWRVVPVSRLDYGKTLGELCGMPGLLAHSVTGGGVSPVYLGDELPAEMAVFCGFAEGELDTLLAAWRMARVPAVERKAILTPTNAEWLPPALCEELGKEHEYMKTRK